MLTLWKMASENAVQVLHRAHKPALKGSQSCKKLLVQLKTKQPGKDELGSCKVEPVDTARKDPFPQMAQAYTQGKRAAALTLYKEFRR